MRTVLKQQTENFIQVIQKAHKVLGEAVDACNLQTALQLLEECQAGAISLGTTMEEYEGEGFVTVGILEEYCEHIYQTYEALSQNHFVDSKKVCQELDDTIAKVWDSIKDIPVKKEVVFLPYKASMWDSLESVWMAADADPECDAYVIPIPYYDKNPDGTFKEMHYEGNLYPDYVPITDYNSYDFQSRRPDMIFIHNPYDGNNYITSVPPFFYSSNLKNFTDKLVYIPYFVLGEVDPKNAAAVKGMEHFVTVPGVIHAHTVIVQSANMRQVYIDVMSRMAGENTRSYWEGKILGLGSPKFDKVHNTKKENVKVPEEWLDIIQKPDGSWKKVIFYNTSVGALLQNGEKMLEKMKDAFRTFEENKEEVALLWRPHPLMKATIESMRPQLWEEYQGIVEQYKDEGWGIYDDTADMDRAIALCDGYYGDGSSVVQLCEEAGKPVMLQEVDILDGVLKFQCINIIGNRLYILTRNANDIFCYDMNTEMFYFCGSVKDGNEYYSTASVVGDKIYYFPHLGSTIWELDTTTGALQKYPFQLEEEGVKEDECFRSIAFEDSIYVLCGKEHCRLLKFDTKSKQMISKSGWIDDFEKRYGKKAAFGSLVNVCVVKNCLWIPLNEKDILLQYDMKKDFYFFHQVGNKGYKYITINYDGQFFYMTDDENVVVRWNREKNEVVEFSEFPKGFKRIDKGCAWRQGLFFNGQFIKKKIYYAPQNSNMLVCFDVETGKMVKVSGLEEQLLIKHVSFILDYGVYMEVSDNKSYLVDFDGNFREFGFSVSKENILSSFWGNKKMSYKNLGRKEGFKEKLIIFINKVVNSAELQSEDTKSISGIIIYQTIVER